MPDYVTGIKGKDIWSRNISIDLFVGKRLRDI
jgi:hypothetical protein